jgi:glycosyltransferase involved in cell wall biosynthesis
MYRSNLDGKGKVPWEECVFGLLADIATLLQGRSFDLIHAQNQVSVLLGAMIKLGLNCPLVCTMHEQYPEREAFGSGRSRVIYAHLPYDMLIAGSEYYHQQALSFGAPQEKVLVVYHGIDLSRFRPGLPAQRFRQRLGLAEEVPLVLVSGRFSPRKGQLDFVRAMTHVRQSIPEARGCLVGNVSSTSPEYLQAIKDEIFNLGLTETITIIEDEYGWSAMPDVYAGVDLVVQPSYGEGLGLALIEAMACGKAVIGTNVTGIREVIVQGETGLLVPPASPELLAAAIVDLLLNKKKAVRLASAGLAEVQKRFSLERMVAQIEHIYYSLCQ